MKRTPFDLGFAELASAGKRAADKAREDAKRAGVPIADVPWPVSSPTGWTNERVELLKELWGDGLSATKIAKRLSGVTRDGVLQKVGELDLGGRRRAAATGPTVKEVVEGGERATVLTLGAHMCKWPIGDPSTHSFTFCGRRSVEGGYCVEHARVAFPRPARPNAMTVIDLRHRRGG